MKMFCLCNKKSICGINNTNKTTLNKLPPRIINYICLKYLKECHVILLILWQNDIFQYFVFVNKNRKHLCILNLVSKAVLFLNLIKISTIPTSILDKKLL